MKTRSAWCGELALMPLRRPAPYEHAYPEGHKIYFKTKPLRLEEFAPEKTS